VLAATVALSAQAPDRDAVFDKVLDTYVRDGYVYYKALQIERARFDGYVRTLDVPAAELAARPKPEQIAFWINAYNALVMKTVIDAYPIKGKSADYPANSVRQIPGAFEVKTHKVAGQTLTLDAIEKTILIPFGDSRILLALGRGAIGSGRLKSEVYRGDALNDQLETIVKEFAARTACFKVDAAANTVTVSPLFSWRQDAFIAGAKSLESRWLTRSPIEQAILGLISPKLFQSEQQFLLQNTFQLKYGAFDWRLNDLTGGVPN
jgi:hypothetical protein